MRFVFSNIVSLIITIPSKHKKYFVSLNLYDCNIILSICKSFTEHNRDISLKSPILLKRINFQLKSKYTKNHLSKILKKDVVNLGRYLNVLSIKDATRRTLCLIAAITCTRRVILNTFLLQVYRDIVLLRFNLISL